MDIQKILENAALMLLVAGCLVCVLWTPIYATVRLERLKRSQYAAYRSLEIAMLSLSRAFAIAAYLLTLVLDEGEMFQPVMMISYIFFFASVALDLAFLIRGIKCCRYLIKIVIFREDGTRKIESFTETFRGPLEGECLFEFAQVRAKLKWADMLFEGKIRASGESDYVEVLDIKVLPPED